MNPDLIVSFIYRIFPSSYRPRNYAMPKLPVKLTLALALAGVGVGDAIPLNAQDQEPGEVTITDSRPEPITESEPLPIPGEGASEEAGSQGNYSPYSLANYGNSAKPYMPNGGTPIQKKDWYGYQNNGPWMRPIRRPLYRVPVQYARYWPSSYYTGGYSPLAKYAQPLPMVYQPTDTTQLGFYHQRVPTWQPRPNAIPGPPWPPAWHYAIPVRYGTYRHPQGQRPGMDPYAGGYGSPGYAGGYDNGMTGTMDSSGVMPYDDSQIIDSSPAIGSDTGEGSTAQDIPVAPSPTDANN